MTAPAPATGRASLAALRDAIESSPSGCARAAYTGHWPTLAAAAAAVAARGAEAEAADEAEKPAMKKRKEETKSLVASRGRQGVSFSALLAS